MITVSDIVDAIKKAPPNQKIKTAEKMLEKYDGPDKKSVRSSVMATACNQQSFPIPR